MGLATNFGGRGWGCGAAGGILLAVAVARAQVALPVAATNAPPPPLFQDPDRPIAERVADLVGRMTLEEKVAYLGVEAPAIPRLGIPAYSWRNEGNRGICRSGRATVYPQAIALAATWNTGLVWRVGSATGDEARIKHRESPTQNFHGLTYWAPVTDLVRDPRWGRAQDTYGEDPFLVGRFAVAYTRGMQGDHPKYLKVAASPKHFAVYGQETERSSINLEVSERALREYYLVPFHAAFTEGKAASVMTAFPGVNGLPCAANRRLVTEILRGEWGFRGPAVTDLGAVSHVKEHFKLVATPEEAMGKVVAAGLDILGTSGAALAKPLMGAVRAGLVTESQLDESLARSLGLRFRLGMFDPPERVPWTKIPDSALGCAEHVALAREAARECMVLLKNAPPSGRNDPTPLLPLDRRKIESIAVVGPYAERVELGHVASSEPAQPVVSVFRGIQEHAGERVVVRAAPWYEADPRGRRRGEGDARAAAGQKAGIEAALKLAARSDVVVAAVGNGQKQEWEGRDRLDLNLPREQEEFLEKLMEVNPATVVVLHNGGAVAVNRLQQHAPAILEAWYPGEQGGHAIAEVLFGDHNPGGRMPLTTFSSVEQLPPLNDCEVSRGRTYQYFKGAPLYPFGHGLSYTRFEYAGLHLDRERARATDTVQATAEVRNVGGRDGDEVVQLYVKGPGAGETGPIHQLRGFQRVAIPAGHSRKVVFPLRVADLASWSDEQHRWVVVPGAYEAQVGASSADLRLRGSFRVE